MRKPFTEEIIALDITSDEIEFKRIENDIVIYDLFCLNKCIASDRYRKFKDFDLSPEDIIELSVEVEVETVD